VGEYFIDSLFADIDSLILNATLYPVFKNGYRHMLARRFPYSVYYKIENQTEVVYAVLDSRRDPHLINERLR